MINCMSKQEFRRWEKQNVNCSRERERRENVQGREEERFLFFIYLF